MPIDISKITGSISRAGSNKTDNLKTGEANSVGERKSDGSSSSHSSFSKGQVFRGQITNISPNTITIELENGDVLNAKYENAADLSIGDGAKFKVLSTEDNSLRIKALTQPGGSIDNAVYKALEASGLPFSEKNEELITALLKNELPVNKQMIGQVLHQSLKNPDISLSNLVLMNKAGLPITEEITSTFEAYSTENANLLKKIDTGFQDILQMIDGLISENDIEAAGNFTSKLFDSLNIGLEADEFLKSNLLSFEEAPSSQTKNLLEFNKVLKEALATEKSMTSIEAEREKSPLFHPETTLSSLFSEEELLNIFTAFENSDVDAGLIQKLISGELTLGELSGLIDKLSDSELTDKTLLPKVLQDFVSKISQKSENILISELLPKEANLPEAAEIFKTLLNSNSLSGEQKRFLLKSPELKQTLDLLLKADFTFSPEELFRKNRVQNFYNRANHVLEKLNQLSLNHSEFSSNLTETLSSVKAQLHFLNTLAPLYQYVELPLRLHGQTAKGDLFVYSNKKKKASDGSISCLLHLDMKHLGEMNVRIELKEQSVSAKFYLEDEESGKLISTNLNELDKAIEKQGFSPKSEVVKISKKEKASEIEKGRYNLVKDFIPSELSKNNFTRYTFDVRA